MLWGFPHCYPVKFVRPRLPTIHPPTRQVYQSPKCGIWADTAVRKWESTKCWINILFKHTENVVVTHLFCDDDTKCLLSQFFFKHTAVRAVCLNESETTKSATHDKSVCLNTFVIAQMWADKIPDVTIVRWLLFWWQIFRRLCQCDQGSLT